MTESLFRREALKNRKGRALGDVIIVNPPSFAVLTGATLLALILVAAFLSWGEYARKETVLGYLVPDKGLVKLHAPFAGVVTERRAEEGTPVRAGDTLFVVAASGSAVDVTVAKEVERSRAALRIRIEQEIRALLSKIESLKAELGKSARELDIQRQRLELDTQALQKLNELADQGHYPLQQFHQRERQHLELRALVEAVERNRLTLARELRSAQSLVEIVKLRNAARLNDYDSQISQLDQRFAGLRSFGGGLHMKQVKMLLSKVFVGFCIYFTTFFIFNDITAAGVSTKNLYITGVLVSPAVIAFVEFLARRRQSADSKK